MCSKSPVLWFCYTNLAYRVTLFKTERETVNSSKDEINLSRLSSVLKSLQPTGQKARAIQSCHPSISRRGQPCHQAKGESGDSIQHSHKQQCGRYQTLRIWGQILVSPSGLARTTLSYLYPTAERPKFFHPSQLPLLRTSQIQLRDEVKNSCDGVRRGVQRPRTQATAGNQLRPEA